MLFFFAVLYQPAHPQYLKQQKQMTHHQEVATEEMLLLN